MENRVKLLHLAQSAGYGVTIYVDSLIRGLDHNIYHQILLGSQYYDKDSFKKNVDELITIPMERDISTKDIKTIRQCRKIIRTIKPDILYCHSAKAGIYGRIACLFTKTKVVYNPHGWSFNMHCGFLKRFFYKLIEVFFSFFTDRIVTISNYERKTAPCLIPRRKIRTIQNGIDIQKNLHLLQTLTITKSQLGIDENSFVIGLVARISYQKGQDLLVDAASLIKNRIPNAFFILVGGKSDDLPIEKYIEEAGLTDCFLITGEVPDAIRYASLFDVALLTSRWEGFGLVLPEYMLVRKPIVAFNVDAVGEIIEDGTDGLLVEKENTVKLANAVIKLHDDEQLRKEMGENGYNKAISNYDITRVCDEHMNMFNEMLK